MVGLTFYLYCSPVCFGYLEGLDHKVHTVYIPGVPQCLSPRPNKDPPTPLPQESVSPLRNQKGGHTRLQVKGWGSPNSDYWRKIPSTLSILWAGWTLYVFVVSWESCPSSFVSRDKLAGFPPPPPTCDYYLDGRIPACHSYLERLAHILHWYMDEFAPSCEWYLDAWTLPQLIKTTWKSCQPYYLEELAPTL